MARAAKKSDTTYNTRRRFRRAAERFLKKADEATSTMERERWEAAAQDAVTKAISTYEPGSEVRGVVADVAKRAGVDPSNVLRVQSIADEAQRDTLTKKREEQSQKLTATNLQSRDAQGRAILNTRNIGHSIFGGLKKLWYTEGDAEGNANPLPKVLEALGLHDALELVEYIENYAPDLYKKGKLDDDEIYEIVRAQLNYFVTSGRI